MINLENSYLLDFGHYCCNLSFCVLYLILHSIFIDIASFVLTTTVKINQ